MRISLIQMNSIPDGAANLAQARDLAAAAIDADAPDLVSFPENMSWCGGGPQQRLDAAEVYPDGAFYRFCSDLARDRAIWVHAGSIPERGPDEPRNRNTSVVFDRSGSEAARYSKIHMFDMVTPDGQRFCESEVNAPGQDVVTFDMERFRAGLTVCYDVRFAELFVALAKRGANVIFVPAAFTMQTGRDHWEVLLRARAIETQSWIVAAAQWGTFPVAGGGVRQMYGRSLVVDPWGTVVACAADGTGWITARIDLETVEAVRTRMPTLEHRRL